MIILSKYYMEQISERLYYIKCKETAACPHCGSKLRVIGSRKRKFINKKGDKITLVIRRLKCINCKRIHHELPDILVPYKRYESCSIENVLTDSNSITIAAEESTLYRWRKWFNGISMKIFNYLLVVSDVTKIKYELSNYCEYISLIKNYPKWLSIIVTYLVNLNLW